MEDIKTRCESAKAIKDLVNTYVGGPPQGQSDYYLWTVEDDSYSENPWVIADEDPIEVRFHDDNGTIWRGYDPESLVVMKLHTRHGDYYEWQRNRHEEGGDLYCAVPFGERTYLSGSGRKVSILRRC